MAKNMSLSGSEVSHLVIPTEGGGICLMSNGEYRTEMDLFDLMKKDIYKKPAHVLPEPPSNPRHVQRESKTS